MVQNKTFAGNFFENFKLGQILTHGTPRTITEGDVSLYIALTGSRFVINCAQTVAKACGFSKTPVDNYLLFHIAFGKTVPEISLNAVANLGYAECQFTNPAFVGDTISVESTVIGLKENSNGKTGIVYVHSKALNQHDDRVVEWKRWVMVHKKTPSAVGAVNLEPKLDPYVKNICDRVPATLDLSQYNPQWSGSPFTWKDYQVGEVIDHIDGMTINDSDHSLATRLYQNNAKVHFDGHSMLQSQHKQRLVYGGHIISLCRALSHNGLSNGLWLAAINGGTHANPSFAGDTIYCQSQIIDKGDIENRPDLGWLRLITYGFKNNAKASISGIVSNENGRKNYPSDLVLEIDYTLLFPR